MYTDYGFVGEDGIEYATVDAQVPERVYESVSKTDAERYAG